MQISRLRLVGFKSFVEPTELRIERGLTGVVGPNGCGKSNLLEAIRWAMGESSPRSMRGGGMDDVIFAGTETRPARDFAEVALVCETDGTDLPGTVRIGDDGGTLEILRRIERGAGSAYRANGHDVRARDVALIFADAATGAHSPALVSQGKVAAIIAAKPQERRMLLEEAAGIAGLHVRRKEAEQKLRATETNLARLADLLTDMEGRMAALRRQARAAERYTRLTDAIRVAEARMIFARWRDAAAEADRARASAAAAQAEVDASQAALASRSEAQVAAMAALGAARQAANDARDADHAAAAALAATRSDLAAVERQLADLGAEAERINRDREAEDALAREGAAAITRLEQAAKSAAQTIARLEAERPALEASLTAAADALRDAEVALANARAAAANEAAERRIAEAAHQDAQRRHDRAAAEQQRIAAERAALGDPAALEAALRAGREAQEAQQAALQQAEAALLAADAEARDADTAWAGAQDALAEARSVLAALDSEAAALDRSLAAAASTGSALIDQMHVGDGFETALAAALGDELSAPVGEADGGWLGAAVQDGDPALPAGTQPLSAHVRAPAALARRLRQVAVADRDDGQPLATGQRLVTPDGRMRRWDGFVSIGQGAAAAERLVRVNRRAALAAARPAVAEGLASLEVMAARALNDRDTARAQQQLARTTLGDAERRLREAGRAADAAASDQARVAAETAHLDEREALIAADLGEAAVALRTAQVALDDLPEADASAAILTERERARALAMEAMQASRDRGSTLDGEVARAREAQIEAQAEIKGWRARAGEAARRVTAMGVRLDAIADEQARLADRPAMLTRSLGEAEAAVAAAREAATGALESERMAEAALRALDADLEQAREAVSSAREARASATAHAEAAEARRIEMGRISGERFQCPPPLLPEQAGFDGEAVGAPQAEGQAHEALLADRERIGPVNLVAAQELAELEGQHATSLAESEELAQAVNRLRGSIGHLNREGRQRLLEAFEAVNGHFQRLFTTLFGGGAAHLALIESDDVLEAGLEIMAQPPGKKLATLTLLSGGEQALTAIALIFALFLTKPAPICVLDEVDAPLDDANVERFCDLLDAMVRDTRTRYLIVTHNAVTMSRMHRLFGVTMVERGVSRLVSVDLGAATELLAAE